MININATEPEMALRKSPKVKIISEKLPVRNSGPKNPRIKAGKIKKDNNIGNEEKLFCLIVAPVCRVP